DRPPPRDPERHGAVPTPLRPQAAQRADRRPGAQGHIPMTTPDLERRIRTWFADEIGETEAAPSSVHAFLGAIPQSMPRQHGLFGRRAIVLLAAALLVGLLAGAIAVGSGFFKLRSILPPPSPTVEASVQPAPSSSAEPSPALPLGLIAYR